MSSAVRIHWALEELGIPYEGVKLDLKAGDQKKADFLKLNPNGKVPTLVDDGVPMFESVAMLIHLGDKYGMNKNLWPAMGSADRIHALSWTVWSTATLGANLTRWLLNTAEYLPPDHRNALQADAARKEIDENLRILDVQLDGRPYLSGDSFTLVDLANASTLGWAARNGIQVASFPNVASWLQRSTSRPALGKVFTV
jgi:glutathione S-transferase